MTLGSSALCVAAREVLSREIGRASLYTVPGRVGASESAADIDLGMLPISQRESASDLPGWPMLASRSGSREGRRTGDAPLIATDSPAADSLTDGCGVG